MKRTKLPCIALLFALFSLFTAPAYALVVGDINGDGAIDPDDLYLVKQHTMGLTTLRDDCLKAADVNGDGVVDVTDIALIKLYVDGHISSFPAEATSDPVPPASTGDREVQEDIKALRVGPIQADRQRATIGEQVTWRYAWEGGKAPYTVQFRYMNTSTGKVEWEDTMSLNDTSVSQYHHVRDSGRVTLEITVKSADGQTANGSGGAVQVDMAARALVFKSLEADNHAPTVGDTITWTWHWSGGNPPYNVALYVGQDGGRRIETIYSTTKDIHETSTKLSYTFTKSGNMRVLAVITSADGQECQGYNDVTPVTEKNAALTPVSIHVENDSPTVGERVTWTVQWSGGKSPYTVNAYVHLNDNQRWEVSSGSVNGTSYSASYSLHTAGEWVSSYKITSADGQVIECNGGRFVAAQAHVDSPPQTSASIYRPITGVDAGYAGDSGLDIAASIGTPVYAIADGTLEYSQYGKVQQMGPNDTAYSLNYKLNTPITYNGKTIRYVYCTHLSKLVYDKQDGSATVIPVKKGQLIGYSGIANNSAHLHITLYLERSGSYLSMEETRAFFGSYPGMRWTAGDGVEPSTKPDDTPANISEPPILKNSDQITPMKAYNRANRNTTVYELDFRTPGGTIYGEDECVILAVYQNGYLKVQYPISGGTKTRYAPYDDFFSQGTLNMASISRYAITYKHSSGSEPYGSVSTNDTTVCAFATENGRTQIAYPVDNTANWKLAWVDSSAVRYGSGTTPPQESNTASSFQFPISGAYCTWQSGGNAMSWSAKRGTSAARDYHLGIDIAGSTSDVCATANGTVAATGYNSANGNYVILQHTVNGSTVYSFYAHLASVSVAKGNTVAKGTKIGVMGNTGSSTASYHLHFAFVNTLWSNGAYYGYATNFSGDKITYEGVTYYNPVFIVNNGYLP